LNRTPHLRFPLFSWLGVVLCLASFWTLACGKTENGQDLGFEIDWSKDRLKVQATGTPPSNYQEGQVSVRVEFLPLFGGFDQGTPVDDAPLRSGSWNVDTESVSHIPGVYRVSAVGNLGEAIYTKSFLWTGSYEDAAELEASARQLLEALQEELTTANRYGVRRDRSQAVAALSAFCLAQFDDPTIAEEERNTVWLWVAAQCYIETKRLVEFRHEPSLWDIDTVQPPVGSISWSGSSPYRLLELAGTSVEIPLSIRLFEVPLNIEDLELAEKLGYNALSEKALEGTDEEFRHQARALGFYFPEDGLELEARRSYYEETEVNDLESAVRPFVKPWRMMGFYDDAPSWNSLLDQDSDHRVTGTFPLFTPNSLMW